MDQSKSGWKKAWLKLTVLAAIAAVIFVVFRVTPLSVSDFTPSRVRDFILQFGVWSPIVFMILYALRGAVLVLPVGIMSLAGGLAFGQWWGTLYILIGATLGASLSFVIARFFGRQFIENFSWLHNGKIKQFDDGIEKNGFRMMLFMRLIPLFQYDAVNFGGGLSRIKFRDFFFASFVGMAPGGFINAMLGSSLDNIISVQFFAALGFFVLLMFIPTLYKKIVKKKTGKTAKEKIEQKAKPDIETS
ncbi:MAG: TVP38/TMEM64 family protein [candidate division KSB1 bacterium]|nr:TVP38/TMEM64 family protein [candidate division KSB1 bacterium]